MINVVTMKIIIIYKRDNCKSFCNTTWFSKIFISLFPLAFPFKLSANPKTLWHLTIFQLFAIVVFGCISSQGWTTDPKGNKTCLYNGNSNACNYGVGIGVIAFLASMGFLAGEYLFEQMSSVKTRKHFVLGDLGFSSKKI